MIIHWQSNHTYYPWYGNVNYNIYTIVERLPFDLEYLINKETEVQNVLFLDESVIVNLSDEKESDISALLVEAI